MKINIHSTRQLVQGNQSDKTWRTLEELMDRGKRMTLETQGRYALLGHLPVLHEKKLFGLIAYLFKEI